MSKQKKADPRGDGAVRDDAGQSNIIDYSNDEPLLLGMGDNSSHEYPGKIVVNNEPERVLAVNDFQKYGTTNESGKSQPLNDKTEPTLPTGAPQGLYEIDHNAHGLNFNNKIVWNDLKEDDDELELMESHGPIGSPEEELEIGIKVEMEHTDDPLIAEQIAKDHIKEHANYYTKGLIPMEKKLSEMVSVPGSAVEKNIGTDCTECQRKSNEEEMISVDQYPLEMMEAFVEGDHPRAPAGTMKGGEFIKKDAPPMGTSKEERAARDDYYKDTNADNQKVTELSDEITLKTIDANIAKLDKDSEKEKAFREEAALMKIKKDRLIQELQDKDRLEGVQAQRAMHAIEEADKDLQTVKKGTKREEKLLIDKMGSEFRLDLIRRGKLADYDVLGNPTNEMAYQEQQEKKKTTELMAKRPIKTKQKDLETFKGNQTMKLGKSVDKRHVEQIKEIWNNLSDEDRGLVKNLTIRGTRQRGNFTAGEWKPNSTMDITTHPLQTKKDYEEAIHHEIGHAKFRSYSEDKVKAWNAAVKEIRPPTKYAQYHQARFDKYRFNNLRVRESDVEVVKRNLVALENLYYEEVHSEVYSNLNSPLDQKKLWDKEGLEKATKLYKEIFS